MSVTRKWSLLAVVLILAILAAGWFLLVAPKRTEAADLRDQSAAQDAANARLVTELEMLKQQQTELPQKQAELAVMRKQIPDNPALPTLIRNLTQAGRKVGVSVDSMSPAVPAPVAAAVPAVVAAPVTETDSTDSASTSEATEETTTPAPVAAPPAPSLYQVPLTLAVTGSYFELEQFINKLEGLKRSLLVTGFTLGPVGSSSAAPSASDGPAPGDLTLSLQGRVFLAPATTSAAAPQPTPTASTAVTGQ